MHCKNGNPPRCPSAARPPTARPSPRPPTAEARRGEAITPYSSGPAKPEMEGGTVGGHSAVSPFSVQQREKGGPSKRSHVASSHSPARGLTSITQWHVASARAPPVRLICAYQFKYSPYVYRAQYSARTTPTAAAAQGPQGRGWDATADRSCPTDGQSPAGIKCCARMPTM